VKKEGGSMLVEGWSGAGMGGVNMWVYICATRHIWIPIEGWETWRNEKKQTHLLKQDLLLFFGDEIRYVECIFR
jgi:hypothetical protein